MVQPRPRRRTLTLCSPHTGRSSVWSERPLWGREVSLVRIQSPRFEPLGTRRVLNTGANNRIEVATAPTPAGRPSPRRLPRPPRQAAPSARGARGQRAARDGRRGRRVPARVRGGGARRVRAAALALGGVDAGARRLARGPVRQRAVSPIRLGAGAGRRPRSSGRASAAACGWSWTWTPTTRPRSPCIARSGSPTSRRAVREPADGAAAGRLLSGRVSLVLDAVERRVGFAGQVGGGQLDPRTATRRAGHWRDPVRTLSPPVRESSTCPPRERSAVMKCRW